MKRSSVQNMLLTQIQAESVWKEGSRVHGKKNKPFKSSRAESAEGGIISPTEFTGRVANLGNKPFHEDVYSNIPPPIFPLR